MPPASRITDLCGTPAPAGAIVEGSPNIVLGWLPAAREGDDALIGQSIDVIEQGEMSVHFNNHEAVRIGDLLKRGPKVLTGLPTVLIGPDKVLPCDVETLTIEVETIKEVKKSSPSAPKPGSDGTGASGGGKGGGGGGDAAPPAKKSIVAVAKRTLRLDAPPKAVPEDVRELLATYDMVIDVVAGFRDKDNAQKTIDNSKSFEDMTEDERVTASEASEGAVRLSASSTYHTGCTRRMHPRMRLMGMPTPEELPKELVKRAMKLPSQRFHAMPMDLDMFNHKKGLDVLFQFFRYLFGSPGAKQLIVTAQSCGSRPPGEGNPNLTLSALVRIYRKDKWAVKVGLPALGVGKYEETKYSSGQNKGHSTETSAKATLGHDSEATKTTTYEGPKGTSTTTTTTSVQDGVSTKDTRKDGTREDGTAYGSHALEITDQDLVKDPGFSVIIERNGKKCDLTALVTLAKEIAEDIKNWRKVVEDTLKALKAGPQIGWKLSLTLSFLEGSLKVEWEPETGEPIEGRYWPRTNKWSVDVDLMLLNLAVEVSFGIELRIWKIAEFVAKVYFKASGKLSTKFNCTSGKDEHGAKRQVELLIKGELGLTAEVSVVGLSLVDLGASVEAGIKVVSTLGLSQEKGLYFEMRGDLTEAVAKAHVYIAFGITWKKKFTLWNEKPLMPPITL